MYLRYAAYTRVCAIIFGHICRTTVACNCNVLPTVILSASDFSARSMSSKRRHKSGGSKSEAEERERYV